MNNYTNFVIVTFMDENDAPGIVASNWLRDSKTCYYPNVRTEEMKNKLLKRLADPESTWPQYNIRILKSYETYGEARLHLKKAEETSNLDSDEEVKKRKRKIKNVHLPGDTSSSDESPPLKMIQKQKKNKKIRDNNLQYPTPPEFKVNSDRMSQNGNITVNENLAVANISSSTSKNAEETPTEVVEVNSDIMTQNEQITVNENLAVINIPSLSTSTSKNAEETPAEVGEVTPARTSIEIPIEWMDEFSSQENVNSQSGCTTSKQFAVQQSHLIQVVTDLSNQVTELNRKVDLLLGRRRSAETLMTHTDDNADLLASLPVKDYASFEHFNNQLKINQKKQAIMSFLAGIGGRNLRSLATNILRRIILDDVAELYSLTGKQMKNSNKKSFLDTEVFNLIFQICKKVYDDTTETKLKEIISDWLNQAKVRVTRRAERQNKD